MKSITTHRAMTSQPQAYYTEPQLTQASEDYSYHKMIYKKYTGLFYPRVYRDTCTVCILL